MINDLTNYQIYLMLLGYLANKNDDNTQVLKSVLTELYKRADKLECTDKLKGFRGINGEFISCTEAELQGARDDNKSKASDTLIVTFDRSVNDRAGICISRVVKRLIDGRERAVVLKAELGEQADILYHLLTEQMTKAEIKEVEV